MLGFENLCACVSSLLNQPSVGTLLEKIATDEVCISTQCFDGINSMVPMHAPSNGYDAAALFLLLILLLALALNMPLPHSKPVQRSILAQRE